MSAGFGPRTGRTSLAVSGARGVTREILSEQPRRDVIRNTIFAAVLFFAVALSLAGLAALILDTLIKGAPALNADLIPQNGPQRHR